MGEVHEYNGLRFLIGSLEERRPAVAGGGGEEDLELGTLLHKAPRALVTVHRSRKFTVDDRLTENVNLKPGTRVQLSFTLSLCSLEDQGELYVNEASMNDVLCFVSNGGMRGKKNKKVAPPLPLP